MIERHDAELPPDPGSTWGRAVTWGAVSSLVFASLVIATWGFVALGLDRDVIDLPGVSVLVAPLAVAAGTVVVAASVTLALRRRYRGRPGVLWLAAPGSILAWLAFAIAAGIAATGSRAEAGDPDAISPLPSQVAIGLSVGPFGLSIVPLAALVILAAVLSTSRPTRPGRGPA